MALDENLPFHRKYRPNTLAKYIGNKKLKETAIKALQSGKRPQVILLWGDSGCGKAQPLDSPVLTIDGFKKMGDIAVGDIVFTKEGNRGSVFGVYPQGVRPIYRITLSDRTCIDVSDEHLNCVYLYNSRKKQREDYVLTTLDLIELFNTSKDKLRIDIPSVDWDYQDVPLDPYLVGVLLGDGCLSGNNCGVSNNEADIISKVDAILRDNYGMELSGVGEKCDYKITSLYKPKYVFTYKDSVYHGCIEFGRALSDEGYPDFDNETLVRIGLGTASVVFKNYPDLDGAVSLEVNEDFYDNQFRGSIRSLGLNCKSVDKFIPECYLYNNRQVRVALLQGLFDTDGTVSKTGQAEFSTSSKRLSDDFSFLVRSLGIRDTVSVRDSGYKVDDGSFVVCGKSYRHFLKVPSDIEFFTSVKHSNRYNKKQNEPMRSIKSIEYIGDKECQCIMVDHPDHTYISDFFIPTHNTTFARLLAKEYSCENRDDEKGACGSCTSCQVIDEYITTGNTDILTNIQEINIADQSGKRDLDAVLEDMAIPAFGDEWKIYIFDECHEASSGLQNKMLKIAEEPPENVLMLFCTTNPEKMIDTLKNRCQLQLHVTKPNVKELAGLLRYVCENEGVEYDMPGLEFIANRGELTIRTALTNLQQVVTEQNMAYYNNATAVFEAISSTLVVDFFKALKRKDTFRYITLLNEIKSKSDLVVFLNTLKDFVQRGIYTINGIKVDGVSDGELVIYRDLFGDMGVAQISFLLSKLLNLNTKSLELELMMLGYTGILDGETQSVESVFDAKIHSIENELAKESEITDTILKEKRDEEYNTGVENSKNMMQNVDIEDLLKMGGTLIVQTTE